MRRYKISEFSKLMGVTTDLVKHYQDTGILSPEVNKTNKYRYYTIRHGERIVASRRFRSMGFGLPDTKTLLYEKDADGINDMLLGKLEENERAINMMQLKNNCLKEMQQEYKELLEKAGTFEIKESPAFYYVPHVVELELNEKEEVVEEIADWMEHLECAYKAYMVQKPKKGSYYNDRSIGLLMKECYFNALGIHPSNENLYLPQGRQLLYYYRQRYDRQLRFSNAGEEVLTQAIEAGFVINPEFFMMQHIFDDHVEGVRYANYIIRFYLQ